MRLHLIPLALVAGCAPVPADIDRAEAERFIGMALPPDATGVRIGGERGMDLLVLVHFYAPLDQATRFATDVLGKPLADDAASNLGHYGPSVEWWRPSSNGLGGAKDDDARNRHYRIALVPDDSGRAAIWLVAFET